jgi:cytochrome c
MKAYLMMVAAAGSMMLASQAGAVDMAAGLALANKSGCMACHNENVKVLGPAYKDVAAKYKGKPEMEAKLIDKVKKGGSGVWGPIPMTPNSPKVSDADIKTLVEWVLAH